jgi:hypothetical protein
MAVKELTRRDREKQREATREAVLAFVEANEKKGLEIWQGTPSQLHPELRDYWRDQSLYPGGANRLSHLLQEVEEELLSEGIEVYRERTATSRWIGLSHNTEMPWDVLCQGRPTPEQIRQIQNHWMELRPGATRGEAARAQVILEARNGVSTALAWLNPGLGAGDVDEIRRALFGSLETINQALESLVVDSEMRGQFLKM